MYIVKYREVVNMRVYYIKVMGRLARVTDCYDVHKSDVYWMCKRYGHCRVNYGDVDRDYREYEDMRVEAQINNIK